MNKVVPILATMLMSYAVNVIAQPIRSAPNKTVAAPLFLLKSKAKIISQAVVEGGLTMWTVGMPDGKRAIFYTTPDQKIMIAGTLFEAETGKNISDRYFLSPDALAQPTATDKPTTSGSSISSKSAVVSAMSKDPVEHLRTGLTGIIDAKNTQPNPKTPIVYIFFDPLCKFCHNLYKNTRGWVERGATIKWLPVDALGKTSVQLSAALLQAGRPGLNQMVNDKLTGNAATESDKKIINDNMLMASALAFTVGKPMATPMVAYVERSGLIAVKFDDGSAASTLNEIFWESKK